MNTDRRWLENQDHFIKAPEGDKKEMARWFLSRPKEVREAFRRCPPWKLYRIKRAGKSFGYLYSYEQNKDGSVTCKINITQNTLLPRMVFGVHLEDLVEVKVKVKY